MVHLVEQRRAPARRPPRLHVLAVELVDLLEREALDLGDAEPDVAEAVKGGSEHATDLAEGC